MVLRTTVGIAALLTGCAAGCATGSSRYSQPSPTTPVSTLAPPPTSSGAAATLMKQSEAVELGSAYAQQMGYPDAQLQDVSPLTGSNAWRLRFGIRRAQGRRTLQLDFDRATRKLMKSEEVEGLSARVEQSVEGTRPAAKAP